jgi:hypothetical protein
MTFLRECGHLKRIPAPQNSLVDPAQKLRGTVAFYGHWWHYQHSLPVKMNDFNV